ncbi:unnamed protein product, partial [Mesorhabditis spiculigera]
MALSWQQIFELVSVVVYIYVEYRIWTSKNRLFHSPFYSIFLTVGILDILYAPFNEFKIFFGYSPPARTILGMITKTLRDGHYYLQVVMSANRMTIVLFPTTHNQLWRHEKVRKVIVFCLVLMCFTQIYTPVMIIIFGWKDEQMNYPNIQGFDQELNVLIQLFTFIHHYLYVPLCLIGVFANVAIVIVLVRPAMRRNPFNVFLVAIAVCDATLMATYLVYKHVDQCHPWYFSYPFLLYTKYYAMVSVFVHSLSLWLTVNMAVLRYMVLYRGQYPQSSIPNCNNYSSAFLSILFAVIIAVVGSLPNILNYQVFGPTTIARADMFVPSFIETCKQGSHLEHWERIETMETFELYTLGSPTWWNCDLMRLNYWMVSLVLKLVPCILLTIFMSLLVRMLMEARERRSRLCNGATAGNSQAERTTTMLTGIVAVFLITEAPQGILGLAVGFNRRLQGLSMILTDTFDLLSLINSSVNFVLYALMSHVFRREFLLTFGACCPQSTEQDSGAVLTKAGSYGTQKKGLARFLFRKRSSGFAPVPTKAETQQTNNDA